MSFQNTWEYHQETRSLFQLVFVVALLSVAVLTLFVVGWYCSCCAYGSIIHQYIYGLFVALVNIDIA